MVVLGLYSGKLIGQSFEEVESLRRYLNAFLDQKEITITYTENSYTINDSSTTIKERRINKGSSKHISIPLENDLWFIVYEECLLSDKNNNCIDGKYVEIVPTTHDTYSRTVDNPFRGPNTRRVLRLDNGDNNVELVSSFNIGKYIYRYIKKPSPIVLVNLPSDLSIEGVSKKTECKAPQELHRMILDLALLLAVQTAQTNNGNDLQS